MNEVKMHAKIINLKSNIYELDFKVLYGEKEIFHHKDKFIDIDDDINNNEMNKQGFRKIEKGKWEAVVNYGLVFEDEIPKLKKKIAAYYEEGLKKFSNYRVA